MSSPAGGKKGGILGWGYGMGSLPLHTPAPSAALPNPGACTEETSASPLDLSLLPLPLASCSNRNILIKMDSVGSVEPGKPAAEPAFGAWALNICFLLKALWKGELAPPPIPSFSPFGDQRTVRLSRGLSPFQPPSQPTQSFA